MEPSQEWSICTEINSEGIDFVVPDSLSHESFLTAHSSRNLPGLQSHPESVSPVLFDCNEENPIKIMASDKHGKNPFAVESEMETDPADALVADTASDHSGNSLREESDTNVTVVQRLPAEATPRQTSTPAQMLTCLQLSGNPINVPETMDSLDAVSPTLDVFDPHPTVVPDSPSEDHDNLQDIHQSEEPKENDDDDEDDDVVSFKPLASTMKKDEEMVTQAETQQSVGLLGSQNFHLRFSPSQATSVYGEKDDVTDDYGLMHAAAAAVPDEQSQEPDVVLESQGQATLAESVDRSKPSFCLQKPADTFEDTALPGEGSEGSISVFKRIKAGVSSPLKLKKVADDSEEMEISRTASRRHLQIFDVGELSASKSEHSTLPTTSKSVFLKEVKESFSTKDNKGTTKTSLSDVKKQEKAGDKNLQKRSQKEQHQTMVISQEIDSPCDDQNDTISYSYSEDRNPTDVAATGDKSMDLGDPFLNPSDLVKNQLSDSGSDNFMLSQKRMVPAAKTNIAESFKGFEPPLDKDESVLGIHSLKDKSLQVASDFPLPKQTDTSKQKSSKKDPNTALQRDVLDFEVMEEREKNNNTTGASKEVASSITKSQLFSEGSTLAQSTSLDPYTFRDSQSQSFAAGPTMPLSDKPYISARGKKAAVVKTMRKVLRKKHPSQQADGKSSSSDASVSKPSKLRQGRRKKETLQGKSESFDAAGDAQAAESAGSKGPLEGFTVLQDHEKFSRPVDPPPTKHSIKHVSEPGGVSGHPDSHNPSKESHPDSRDAHKHTKKNATVSFSTHAITTSTARDLPDSPDQEIERTTIQELVASEVIITKKITREVLNSKGESLHKTETTEVVQEIKFEPRITQQTVTEKVITAGHLISPSRSTSTVTTGDLADISSSSLSRTFSSGSKGSLEVLPSSQSLPTPAQRQRSTEKPDVAVSLSHSDTMPGLKAAAPAVLPGVTESGPPAPSKSDSKRSSAGSNTGQDLFSTPNQSIINPADSQLGKILSSSASSTPDNPPAKIGLTSPPHGLTAPGTSRATTLGDVASSAAALFLGSASSSSYPVAVKNPSPASPLPSSRSFPKSQPRTVSATRSSDPHKISSGESFQKEDHQTKETPDVSAFDGRALRTSNSAEPKTCAELAASMNSFTPRMRDKRKRNPSNQASGHVSKDDVSQSTDIQSTGFSVHGVPPSTASNDSRKGLASDATLAKTDAGDRAELGLQSGITRDQPWPCVLSDYKSKPTIGAKVMGRWKDGFYYPGSLSKIEPGKRVQVMFDDGSQRWVRLHEIIMASDLPVGQSVMVLSEGEDGFYLPGMVMGHLELPSNAELDKFYQVERDDGVTQRCKRSSLILSEDQAACLLSDEELRFTADAVTPSTSKPADISLDNLVEGKRHPRVAHQADASTSKDAAQASPAKTNRTDTASDTLTKSGRKRKMGPVATSTPTPKQARQGGKGTPVKGNKGNVLGSIISSPMESRKSPRKAKMDLFPSHIVANPSLFDGIVFMLTNAEKSAKWRAYERQLLQYSSLDTSVEESTDIEPDIPPYDKEKLQVLIEQHGGKIVSSLDAKTIASAHQCYLVAAEHQRTVKYMQALAAGVRVISHQWVLVSVQENQLQGLVAYTLPAGISYDERKLVEGSKGCPELSRQVIMVVSGSDDYVKAWTSILSLTQCKLTTKFPARATKNDPGVDVVVSDSTCPSSVVRRCGQLNVPLVSSEWVAQCLINGRMVDFKGNSKYAHDFMEGESIP